MQSAVQIKYGAIESNTLAPDCTDQQLRNELYSLIAKMNSAEKAEFLIFAKGLKSV